MSGAPEIAESHLALDQRGRALFPCLFGAHDFARLDTTPGANSPFAPRAGWAPSADEYVDAIRLYCRSPCGPRQVLTVLARRMMLHSERAPEISGPYADSIAGILSAFVTAAQKKDQDKAAASALKSNSWRARGARQSPGVVST